MTTADAPRHTAASGAPSVGGSPFPSSTVTACPEPAAPTPSAGATLVGATALGVVGALVAIATAAGILMLLREVYVRRQDVS